MRARGFTLIEMIITIVLLSIIAVMSSVILQQGYKSYIVSKNSISADWHGRLALERMARDIRAIYSAGMITTATATQLTFNEPGDTATVTYKLDGSTLMRNNQPLATGVKKLTFTYTPDPPASNLYYITISLDIAADTVINTYATSVYLRSSLFS